MTGFCRDAVYSLTADYNNGALRCDCSPDGSVSFNCDEFGGQCRCRPHIIGRTCSHCRTGYYGFPDCRREIAVCVIGRIHGAIVAATGRSDRRGGCRSDYRRDNHHDDRPMYTLQAIVVATIASWLFD